MGGHALPSKDAFRTGLLMGCGTALLAAAITLTIPARRPGRPVERSATADVPAEAVA
jgi:hypothetical protein